LEIGQRIGRYVFNRKNSERQEQALNHEAATLSLSRDVPKSEVQSQSFGAMDYQEMQEGVAEMDAERIQILKMVEEHKITAEEAAKLLAALEAPAVAKSNEVSTSTQARWLRVRVTDIPTGRAKVNVNVPIGVISAAGKLGLRFGLQKYADHEGIDVDEIIEAIRTGAAGKLVDVTNEQGSEHVEVYVE
jgi:hypothetical protein